jgi:hypothetical protein
MHKIVGRICTRNRKIYLCYSQDAIRLVPDLEQLEESVLNSFDDIVTAAQGVDDIAVKVGMDALADAYPTPTPLSAPRSPLTQVMDVSAERLLSVVDLDHPVAQGARRTISDIVRKNLKVGFNGHL